MPKCTITAEGIYGYGLVLNGMMGNMEGGKRFGPFATKEELLAFYNAEKVENYIEEGVCLFSGGTKRYSKCFRKGGPLEFCNPLQESEFELPNRFGHGVHEVLLEVINVAKTSPFYPE